MNIESSVAELTNKWLRRGTRRSTKELEASINEWIDTWNENPTPIRVEEERRRNTGEPCRILRHYL
jgi:hypothetical protein